MRLVGLYGGDSIDKAIKLILNGGIMMNKVFIVTSGEYSDYGIDKVFSSIEKAKEWIKVVTSMYGGNYNIEPYELDAPLPKRKGFLFFEAHIEADVIVKSNFEFYFADEPTEIRFYRQINDKVCTGTVQLRQGESIKSAKERAVKVVQDEFYQWLMLNKL